MKIRTMKLNQKSAGNNMPSPAAKPEGAREITAPGQYRRLNHDELVRVGDFVANERSEFEPWLGISGFRADSFVKVIYRLIRIRPTVIKKPR